MRIEPLGLEHQDLLYGKFRAIELPVSEYSFANVYLFREAHKYEVVEDGEVFVRGRTYDGLRYLMPSRSVEQMGVEYLKKVLEQAQCFFPIPEEWLGCFDEGDFEYHSNEGDADYLYRVEQMASFGGRRMHNKRNLLSQFERNYLHVAFPLTEDRLGDAREVLEAWQKDSAAEAGQTDYAQCAEALELCEKLILCGIIYYVEEEPVGFVLGDELNAETFALHFAKAKREFKGVYEYMYNTFAKILPRKYLYLNFEQDLDKPALRAAKSSYAPEKMVKKYRVSLRKPRGNSST